MASCASGAIPWREYPAVQIPCSEGSTGRSRRSRPLPRRSRRCRVRSLTSDVVRARVLAPFKDVAAHVVDPELVRRFRRDVVRPRRAPVPLAAQDPPSVARPQQSCAEARALRPSWSVPRDRVGIVAAAEGVLIGPVRAAARGVLPTRSRRADGTSTRDRPGHGRQNRARVDAGRRKPPGSRGCAPRTRFRRAAAEAVATDGRNDAHHMSQSACVHRRSAVVRREAQSVCSDHGCCISMAVNEFYPAASMSSGSLSSRSQLVRRDPVAPPYPAVQIPVLWIHRAGAGRCLAPDRVCHPASPP